MHLFSTFKNTCLGILTLLSFNGCIDKTEIEVFDLKTEYLHNPLSIDAPNPRFSWKIKSNAVYKEGDFKILVGKDSTALANGAGNSWDFTGKAAKNRVVYQGKKLEPFTKYYWKVIVSDASDNFNTSAIANFSTGMLSKLDWQGSWISDTASVDFKPAPYFRKELTLSKKVKKATAYISAAGLFEFHINGEKIGDHFLDPVYTRFDRRNVYVGFDVTSNFKENTQIALGVILGNGWYNHQSTAVWNFDKAGWRKRPSFILNLKLDYEDGTSETVVSDSTWQAGLGEIVFNSIYTAEHIDARKKQEGWDRPGFNTSTWIAAQEVEAPSDKLTAQSMQPIRLVEEIRPVSITRLNDTSYVYDFGRNISGITAFKIAGEAGTTFRLTHAEQLYENGDVDLSNIDVHYRPTDDSDPFQTDIYTLAGSGEESFKPTFNYKGFQYVRVSSSAPVELTEANLTAYFAHSDVPQVGTIHSSNELVNKIGEATNASYLSNLFGYPTDCPQREKNGWTGDAHINTETGLYSFDAITVYEKWMADHRDEQKPNGVLPSIIPTWGGWGYDWGNGPDWTSTIAIIPWELYRFYGDDTALRKNYDAMKKYVDYITSIRKENGLTDWGLGDWVPVKSKTPKEYTSSLYYFVDAQIVAKTAKLLGKAEDFKRYSTLAESIKESINQNYLNTETAIYGSGFQTELSGALYFDVVPEELRARVAKNLADRVIADNKFIDVGLLGTKTILGALSENGYADLAYEVASQEEYPSWGWWIKNGATTLYENWDIEASSDLSRNHIMFGAVGAWFYKALGGILPDEEAPGFKNIILKPNFVTGLSSFEATHEGPYGMIKSSWKRDGELVTYSVIIPSNSTATFDTSTYKEVRLDGDKVSDTELKLEAGEHELSIQL